MRGAPTYNLPNFVGPRIIPADAGSTEIMGKDLGEPVDHPRGCGEHAFDPAWGDLDGGSSPRMRGAPGDGHQPAAARRIIPADAGSTDQRLLVRR